MIHFRSFFKTLADEPMLHVWLETLPAKLKDWDKRHSDLSKWMKAIDKLPEHPNTNSCFLDGVHVQTEQPLASNQHQKLENLLQILHPWRKGPYTVHGVHIDTEWRSDWKWQRVLPHLAPLKNRLVLDVGCGNGYHMWRMLGAGARRVVGIDPSPLFVCQFEAIKKLMNAPQPVDLLPLGIEDLPVSSGFDTVFSMGVFYHRRSPIDHLFQLKDQLRAGGELVLETLVVAGDEHQVLMPESRYAQMHNIWFLPSAKALARWLEKCGFVDVRVVDENPTSLDEQRSTDWMRNESLSNFLDPMNSNLTVEGYPAPLRATLVAKKP
jgi:tRNA (mo5U34)-methyltransferase